MKELTDIDVTKENRNSCFVTAALDVLICNENVYDVDFFGNVGGVELRGVTKGQRN